ncbi:MAG: PAS domain S-box protein [Desulfobacterales bacterium]|uniref:histidine kinase n=1 Tax=Candidatus Desulfaltia bathyphila TaxID=2841697 RepID=A0A8J6N420_9BACT|nr:PAS domain S-box protein [Candidatus Desulfaltia bathyphila]MBL7196296.1 PAS domain S-box protein [Desulfobacterales bacterium]MBL7208445.1 PAS domain S-box protein [Desulfobacterales bacterium]
MDLENKLKLNKAALIISWFIAFLCFILTLMMSIQKTHVGANSLFWIQGAGIFALLTGMAGALFYDQWRFRILQNQISAQFKKLKRYEERYRSLVESAEDFIFTVDGSGRFRSLNSFTAAFFGGTPSQFIGQPLSNLFSKKVAEKQIDIIKHVFQVGKSVRDDFMVTTGEHQVLLNANFMPHKDEKGNVRSVLCIAKDITESKKLENQLVNTEKLASMGTLAAGVAHEINNPLAIILGFADLLLEKCEKNSRLYQDLKTIERHSLHCKAVVENLLRFARHGEGLYEYCDINEAIRNIMDVVKHSLDMNDIELRLNLAPDLPEVKGDLRQMQQVILNLINNAAASMKNGGILWISSALDANNEKVVVIVRDNGHGILPEYMDKIFDPFFTTKSKGEGTGLGLSVSHGIITKYEGAITCESNTANSGSNPKGTTFTITLRIKQD